MTLLIEQSNYRTNKHFYLKHVCVYWRAEFPHLVSYTRFVEKRNFWGFSLLRSSETLSPSIRHACGSAITGGFPRIASSQMLRNAKTSMGWFYGFKLHLVITHTGDLLDVALTPGNIDDRKPLRKFAERLHGSLYADRGYISKDIREVSKVKHKVRKNMEPLDLSVSDEVLLKKRMLFIESVIRELKTQMQLEHSRHRSFENFQECLHRLSVVGEQTLAEHP